MGQGETKIFRTALLQLFLINESLKIFHRVHLAFDIYKQSYLCFALNMLVANEKYPLNIEDT